MNLMREARLYIGAVCYLLATVVLRTTASSLLEQLSHYDTVTFDQYDVTRQHSRVKRGAQEEIQIAFYAHRRHFRLRLRRDEWALSRDLVVEDGSGRQLQVDVRPYTGFLEGEPRSQVHGIISSTGTFEGKVISSNKTYSIEDASKHFSSPVDFHAIIYSSDHLKVQPPSPCKSAQLHEMRKQSSTLNDPITVLRNAGITPDDTIHHQWTAARQPQCTTDKEHQRSSRKRRAVDPNKTTCLMYVQADHKFYEKQGSLERVLEQITQHIQGVNAIYNLIDLDGNGTAENIGFMAKRIKVWTDPSEPGYKFNDNFGVEKFLEIFSVDDFDDFCLAYIFTHRDFEGGTLGLAWTGDLVNAGGVCEKNGYYMSQHMSLNTGTVTTLNYGKDVSPVVSHVTFAHEIGHNMGSQHDPESDATCSPGGTSGNYIMYPKATSGTDPNNKKFSPCSISYINSITAVKARETTSGCFVTKPGSICGNEIIEAPEVCDCGWFDTCNDTCCNAMNGSASGCQLKGGASCSPSQGECCNPNTCQLYPLVQGHVCRQNNSCAAEAICNGTNATCPASAAQNDRVVCDDQMVCLSGECSVMVCEAHSLETCQCSGSGGWKDPVLCTMCCQIPGLPATCQTAADWNKNASFTSLGFILPEWMSRPGQPCNSYTGYCDVFDICREIDPSGPLTALKNALFSKAAIESFQEYITEHWYIPVGGVVGLILFMALFIKFCGKKVPMDTKELKGDEKKRGEPRPPRPNKVGQGWV